MSTLTFEPLIPPTLWVTLALVAAGLMVWYGLGRPGSIPRWRWAAILTLMTAGLTLALLVLLNPTWVEAIAPPAGQPVLTLLVDSSASMATSDAADSLPRYEAAASLAARLSKDLDRRFAINLRTFDASALPAQTAELAARAPEGEVTDLAAALIDSVDHDRPQGQAIVLLSDGIHNAPGGTDKVREAVRFAEAMAAPVYTTTFGGQATVRDLAAEIHSPQQLAYVGQRVPVTVRVKHRGLAGGQVEVTLRYDGEEIERQMADILAEGSSELRFYISKEEPGLYRYEVRVEPIEGEVTRVNNSAAYVLHVVDEPIRILLCEGKPYWDTKFLMRTLAADPSIALDSVVRLTDSRLLRRTLSRADPARVEAGDENARLEKWKVLTDPTQVLADPEVLRTYQIVVLGRDAEHFLTDTALSNLRTWISQDGGSLVCYRGQPVAQVSERLGRLMPVHWSPTRESRFRMRLTELGLDAHWLPASADQPGGNDLADLPTLASIARPGKPKPLAVVLAATVPRPGVQEEPALSYQPYGMGRVVVVEGAGMWRWAFLPPEHQEHDEIYSALWHSLLRWLVSSDTLLPGQDVILRADRVTFNATEPVTATLLVREEAAAERIPAIELSGEALQGKQVFTPVAIGDEPGTFRIVFGQLPEGRYQARVADTADQDTAAAIAFDVRSFAEEHLNLKARPDLMRLIAEQAGGAVIGDHPVQEITRHFDEHLARSRPQRVRRATAWDRWWVLLGIIGVWGAAWGLRRSGGLI